MEVKLLAFAQAQDQLGFREQQFESRPGETPRQLLQRVAPGFDPGLARVAVQCEYHDWDAPIDDCRNPRQSSGTQPLEVAIIPPVSGG